MKKTDIQRAIDSTEGEIRVLQQVLDRLKAQQAAKPARARKPKPAVVAAGDGR